MLNATRPAGVLLSKRAGPQASVSPIPRQGGLKEQPASVHTAARCGSKPSCLSQSIVQLNVSALPV
eukprot:3487431-Amphidinium_carterae.1